MLKDRAARLRGRQDDAAGVLGHGQPGAPGGLPDVVLLAVPEGARRVHARGLLLAAGGGPGHPHGEPRGGVRRHLRPQRDGYEGDSPAGGAPGPSAGPPRLRAARAGLPAAGPAAGGAGRLAARRRLGAAPDGVELSAEHGPASQHAVARHGAQPGLQPLPDRALQREPWQVLLGAAERRRADAADGQDDRRQRLAHRDRVFRVRPGARGQPPLRWHRPRPDHPHSGGGEQHGDARDAPPAGAPADRPLVPRLPRVCPGRLRSAQRARGCLAASVPRGVRRRQRRSAARGG
ncbi:unnamed protein product, partial [Prorocentrum cordatum]